MTRVKLLQDTADGSEGDIVDLDQTTADIYTREGMATTDFEEEKSTEKGTPTEEKNRIERGRRTDMVGKNRHTEEHGKPRRQKHKNQSLASQREPSGIRTHFGARRESKRGRRMAGQENQADEGTEDALPERAHQGRVEEAQRALITPL